MAGGSPAAGQPLPVAGGASLTGAFMRDDPTLAWPEYLRAWLDALRYHPEQHNLRGSRHAEATSAEASRDRGPPAQQDGAA
ncbi:hypothetical protein ACFQU7_15730 [Pseudoroseomonas wenyumeiae]